MANNPDGHRPGWWNSHPHELAKRLAALEAAKESVLPPKKSFWGHPGIQYGFPTFLAISLAWIGVYMRELRWLLFPAASCLCWMVWALCSLIRNSKWRRTIFCVACAAITVISFIAYVKIPKPQIATHEFHGGNGIHLTGNKITGAVIEGNETDGNAGEGILLEDTPTPTVKGNKSRNNGGDNSAPRQQKK